MHYFQNRGLASRTCHLEDASTDCAEFRFWWSVAVSGFAMGGLVGTFVFPTLANKIGRKRTILSTSVFCYLSCYLIAFPSSWWMLILGRILVGIGAGGACGAVPTYITEIAPNDLRGTLGTVHQLMITIGILTSQALSTTELHLLGEDSRWQYSLLVPFACTTFLVLFGCGGKVVPVLRSESFWSVLGTRTAHHTYFSTACVSFYQMVFPCLMSLHIATSYSGACGRTVQDVSQKRSSTYLRR